MWWTWREEEEDAGWLNELSSNGKVMRYIIFLYLYLYICIFVFVYIQMCNSHPREATTGSKSCEKGFWSNSKPGDELKVPHAVVLWYLSYLDASWLYFISLMVFHIMKKMVTFQYLLLRMTFGYSWCRVNGLADRPNSQLIKTFPFSFPSFSLFFSVSITHKMMSPSFLGFRPQ